MLLIRARDRGASRHRALVFVPAMLAVVAALGGAGCGSDDGGDSSGPPPLAPGTIVTLVGVAGESAFNGDGITLTSAHLDAPQDVELGSTGELVVIDAEHHRVRVCDLTTGLIRTSVGTGTPGAATPGPALQCDLDRPAAATWDLSGNLVVVARGNHRVLRLTAANAVEDVAGNGVAGFAGDGGPALGGTPAAQLDSPTSAGYDENGILYILDRGNGRIRSVDLSGTIHTYAGIGGAGYGGDGAQASAAQFNFPASQLPKLIVIPPDADAVAAGHQARGGGTTDGGAPLARPAHSFTRLYIADTGNHRVRLINLSTGVINTEVGTGIAGYAGDGASGLVAQLNLPSDVALGPDDSVYIADTGNHVIRRLDPLGVISTVAGNGSPGYGGDGGPATSAQLNAPAGVYVDANNVLYIADTGNHVIRKVNLGN